jgi:uncharacterized protein YdaL
MSTDTFRSIRVVTAFALGAIAGCGTGAISEDEAPLRKIPDPGAIAGKDLATARTTIWNPGVHGRGGTHTGPGTGTNTASGTSVSVGSPRSAAGVDAASALTVLVLYDTTGPWGELGELYAIGATNLVSHFGNWTAKPATAYTCGDLARYSAAIYLGSTFDEPLPTCLLDDVLASTHPVIWTYYNIWQLAARSPTFGTTYGWTPGDLDFSAIPEVDYKGRVLTRYAANADGILGVTVADTAKATVLATAKRSDGTTLPWAVRSGQLTFVTEIPFSYMTESDRYLVFADLLFDALAPATAERHRVVLRLEDINPSDDVSQVQAVAQYLSSQHIPFGFGVIPQYEDPLGFYNNGTPVQTRLDQAPALVTVLQYMASHGGVEVMHGYTHQWDATINPYTGVTADDNEFYRVIENPDDSLNYVGPVTEDSLAWAGGRLDTGKADFTRARLAVPTIFEVPHYAGSVNTYRAIATRFTSRWERSLYFTGLFRGGAPDYTQPFGQLFPYPVRDAYGTRVLPENLGNIEPTAFHIYPPRLPADIIAAGEKNLVVRDGVAGFYFHCFFDIQYLKDTIAGLRALGYTFVSPGSL